MFVLIEKQSDGNEQAIDSMGNLTAAGTGKEKEPQKKPSSGAHASKPILVLADYDASKAPLALTPDVKRALTLPDKFERTESDLTALQAYISGFKWLQDYTRKMQRELCRYMEYERFGSGRVILKEGTGSRFSYMYQVMKFLREREVQMLMEFFDPSLEMNAT
jgi:hypothetical protein